MKYILIVLLLICYNNSLDVACCFAWAVAAYYTITQLSATNDFSHSIIIDIFRLFETPYLVTFFSSKNSWVSSSDMMAI